MDNQLRRHCGRFLYSYSEYEAMDDLPAGVPGRCTRCTLHVADACSSHKPGQYRSHCLSSFDTLEFLRKYLQPLRELGRGPRLVLQQAGEWLLLPNRWYHAVLNVGITSGLVLQGKQPRDGDLEQWLRSSDAARDPPGGGPALNTQPFNETTHHDQVQDL